MLHTYVIGDIHGHIDALEELLEMIKEDMSLQPSGTKFRLIQMGDMIDRGPNSRAVVDLCMQLPKHFPKIEVKNIIGNHEHELVQIYNGNIENIHGWFPLEKGKGGGIETLRSYSDINVDDLTIDNPEEIAHQLKLSIPQSHIDYFESLPAFINDKNYLFVHSGLVPGVPIENQDPLDFIALYKEKREAFMNSTLDHGKIIVHAHTPRPNGEVLPNRVNTDAGAGYKMHLQCAILPESYDIGQIRHLQVKILE